MSAQVIPMRLSPAQQARLVIERMTPEQRYYVISEMTRALVRDPRAAFEELRAGLCELGMPPAVAVEVTIQLAELGCKRGLG